MFAARGTIGGWPDRRAWLTSASNTPAATPTAASVWRRSKDSRVASKLPPISFSTDPATVDAEELADLFSQLAGFAPGHSFNLPGVGTAAGPERRRRPSGRESGWQSSASPSGGDGNGSESGSSSSSNQNGSPLQLSPTRLQAALLRSGVCVAAFASEQYLPEELHLESRGLLPSCEDGSSGSNKGLLLPWWPALQRRRPRGVLVGFVRAVSDGALVATVHDLAVAPQLRGLGLGRQLLDRVTKQLYRQGIYDVGLLAPDPTVSFLQACSFGPDPEQSVTMALTAAGEQRWRSLQWEFAPRPGLDQLLLRAAGPVDSVEAAYLETETAAAENVLT